MPSEKYRRDIERCRQISPLIKERMRALNLKRVDIPRLLKPFINNGNGICSAALQLSAGLSPVQISSDSRCRLGVSQKEHLERLSLFYFIGLGLSEEDDIVRLTREVNPNFVYPPDLNKYCVKRDDEPIIDYGSLSLTDYQRKHLGSLALLFDRANRMGLCTEILHSRRS